MHMGWQLEYLDILVDQLCFLRHREQIELSGMRYFIEGFAYQRPVHVGQNSLRAL